MGLPSEQTFNLKKGEFMSEKNLLVDEEIEILYQAPNKQSGLTITAEIILPSGSKDSNFPDVTLSELLGKGIYSGTFTPNTGGEWKVVVHTDTGDGQVVKRYSVGSFNLHTIGGAVEAASAKVDTIDTKVDDISSSVGALDTPPMIS
jgi:hypothetical protein